MMNEALQQALEKELTTKRKQYPVHSNRISSLDDKCMRKLVYYRTEWDKQKPTDIGLQGIFETGNELEPVVSRIITSVGLMSTPRFRIIQQQAQTRDNLLEKHNIVGHIDGVMEVREQVVQNIEQWVRYGVLDVKTASPYTFNAIDGKDDLNKFSWSKRWIGQLMLYALAENLEKCVILLVNKTNIYQMKLVEFDLDYDYAEGLIAKAEKINSYVEGIGPDLRKGLEPIYPERIHDYEHCTNCPFQHICNPPLESSGNLELSDDAELAELLVRRGELKEAVDEHSKIDKRLKQMLVPGQDLIVGSNVIMWTKIQRKGYTVQDTEYFKWKILDKID